MTFRRGGGVGGGGGGGGRGRFGGRDDRGRPGGRDSGPRGGDRPSNHTSDASMASARIFIGNLPTNDPRLTKEVLEENFSKYGHILGISILKGFGFIQYAEESSAENAIQGSQNLEFFGQRADVKNVKSGKDTGGNGPPAGGESYRDRSPLRRRDRDVDMPPRIRDGDMRAGPSARDMDRAAHDYDDRTRDWGRAADHYHADLYMERDMLAREPYPPTADRSFGVGPPRPAGPPMANDVEIIVTSKVGLMRQYAEQLESRVRAHGMAVDVLFPREDIPIRQVLMDLGERGTLFAFVLSPINEEHRSVTLNILFGQQPEEHRNMPLEDAFGLLTSTFQRYQQQRGGGVGGAGRPEESADSDRPSGPEPHPPSMQTLIDLLHANRPLSVMEYDRLIRYLNERRDRQASDDGRNSASQSYLKGYNANAGPGQENPIELQQRILSILNSSAGGAGAGGLGPVPAPVPAPHLNAPASSWNPAGDPSAQQLGPDMMGAYGAGPVRQPDRPMGQAQPPGGYYGMGKRF